MRSQAPINNHVSSQEEQVSVAEAAAAVAHAASVPGIPLQQVRAKARDLANLLDEHKDEQVLKESCLDLCQLFGEGIQNDRIQSILEAAVVPKLVHLLEPIEKRNGVFEFRVPVSVQSAALQVIGNIACGDDRQTQVIIDCNVLPCLRALLTCDERGIRKECCWIISNISESAHQVQDVIKADILPYLLRLLESQDAACREDATWVLYNVTANRDEKQIDYLSEQGCVRALCSLLSCTKELDVNWKGCSTIAEVALKGLRNVLAVGEIQARRSKNRLNKYAAVVVNSYGVERIEALTHHRNVDIGARSRALLTSFFGAENVENELSQRFQGSISSPSGESSSTADSDAEDDHADEDDTLFEVSVSASDKCSCSACTDLSRLPDKRPSKSERGDKAERQESTEEDLRLCDCCNGTDVVGKTRTVLAIKIGRAVRLGHRHCLAVILSGMTWSQRGSAIEAPSGINSNLLPPEAALTSSLPAFVLAAQGGKADCLELIVRRCQPDLDMTYGKKRLTALAWAAHKGNLRCCKILRESGAAVNAKCADLVSALHLAASSGAYSVCKLLLEHGAEVDAKSSKKQTPLSLAAQRGHVHVVRLLVAAGATTHQEDDQSLTPLHLAALHGHDAVVTVLIEAGADVNAENFTGTTPICYAVQRRHAKCVRILIHGGAKLCVPGSSPLLFIAADEGDVECVKALLDANTKLNCQANIKVLINKDYEMMDSLSPLHLAASKGHDGVVELLLQRGVDVDERSSKGWSALDFAVLNGHVTSANTLIFYGAIVDDGPKIIGRGSWTLVQHAAHSGNKDIVRLLIQRLQEQKVKGLRGGAIANGASWADKTLHPEISSQSIAHDRKKKGKDPRDDDRESHRNRDLKRWTLDAADAKDRLEEAVNQRSISKMKEAIAFANKVLLHMAAGAGDEDSPSSSDSALQQAVQTISSSLSNEIEKSRRELAEEQLVERRKKEKRDADAANIRRGNARKLIRDCMEVVRNGADLRGLQRALKKAQNTLERDDEVVLKANELISRMTRIQDIDRRLSAALAENDIDEIDLAVTELDKEATWHKEHGSSRALEKALACDIESRIALAKERLDALRNELEAAREEQERQRKAEEEALKRLESAADRGSLYDIEQCLQELVDFTSKHTAVRSSVNAVRKSFQKMVKNERRKLRQACATEDGSKISVALEEARQTNLRALESDIAGAQATLGRLEERDLAVSLFDEVREKRDITGLQRIRTRFEELGMLSHAEQARLLGENLQKEERAKNQLQNAISSAEEILGRMQNRENVWPDGKRLLELIKRGRQFSSTTDLVSTAEGLVSSLGACSIELISVAANSGDARNIASSIEAYEKAFPLADYSDTEQDLLDITKGNEAVSEARKKLSQIQGEEQAKALAEAEALTAAMRATAEARDGAKSERVELPEDEYAESRNFSQQPFSSKAVIPNGDNAVDSKDAFVDHKAYGDQLLGLGLDDDDSSEREGSDSSVCVHYYLWRGGSTVVCSRCGNERSSTNTEWLNRVKKRSQKGAEGFDETAASALSMPFREADKNGLLATRLHPMGLDHNVMDSMRPVLMGGSSAIGSESFISMEATRPNAQEDSGNDISAEFAMQNFGFDIDAIVNDS